MSRTPNPARDRPADPAPSSARRLPPAVQRARALAYVLQAYAAIPLFALFYTPLTLVRSEAALWGVRTWCRYAIWSARWMVGLRGEIRGTPPDGPALIAAKHQSFFDIILLVSALPQPRFIMKRELLRTPIVGWYAVRIGCVPVDRGRGREAVAKMVRDVERGAARAGQLIIYPQGTRVAPGTIVPYKTGAGALYDELGATCVPVATNVGFFWPKSGLARWPGTGVVEFLPPIPPGRTPEAFMEEVERVVEAASDELAEEARAQLAPR